MKEKEILKVAKKLFSKYGFKKVSMDEIAKNAGVTKKTVYANFASKEELLNSLIKLELQDMKERFEKMEKEYQTFENLTDEEKARIISIVERYLEVYDENAEKEQWFNTIKELAGEFRIC